MSKSSNDDDLIKAVKRLEDRLGDDFVILKDEEVEGLREILRYKGVIVEWAELQMAKGLLFQRNKSGILTAAAIASALLVLWAFGDKILQGVLDVE